MGDVLVTIINPDKSTQASEQKQDVTRIYEPKTDLTLGYNFFKLSNNNRIIKICLFQYLVLSVKVL